MHLNQSGRSLSRTFAAVAMGMAIAVCAAAAAKKPDSPVKVVKPPANPATKPVKKPAQVSDDAKEVLSRVRDAYKSLKSLELKGAVASDLDVGGEQRNDRAEFTASFSAPMKFRHAIREVRDPKAADGAKDNMILGSTGEKLYVFDPQYKYYQTADAPKDRAKASAFAKPFGMLLERQNLSLMLAIVEDAAAELLDGVDVVSKTDDVKIGDDACPALKFVIEKQAEVVVAFDPKTSLVRRVSWDQREAIKARNQPDVKTAMLTIDFTETRPDADVKVDFAWTPPIGARDVGAMAAAGAADDDADGGAASALVGKPAPDFKLKDLDGNEVSLADLKGSVVILDFWATWCGPCRVSLPELNKIYDEHKEHGLKAYAIDLREKPDTVKKFVDKTKLGIPVLLDESGAVAKQYGVSGIPQTVVIGKDGTVKKVVVGSGTHDQVRAAAEEAMK